MKGTVKVNAMEPTREGKTKMQNLQPNRSPTAMINLAKQVSQSLGTPQAMIIGIAADGLIMSASYGDTKLDCILAGKRLDEIIEFMEKE